MSSPEHRRAYIDRARGIAVLIMILAHVVDAWTRNPDRSTVVFRNLTILGGMAAPLFLWLAGLALALGGERAVARAGNRRAAMLTIFHRGLEIFVLAFVFRLQAFILSPGGPLLALFRVDILNVMGPAIVAAGALWGVARRPRWAIVFCGAAAAAIAMATPVVRAAPWVQTLPIWLQWYLRPAGELTTFTLFPWSGFVFAGAASGSLISLACQGRPERRALVAIGAAGAILIAVGCVTAALPTIFASSSFWTSSPTYFAIRLGLVMLTLAVVFAVGEAAPVPAGALNVLGQFGRRSLFIYWIHVELVYGYASWPLHRSLAVWATVGAYVIFSGVMYGALQLRERASRPTVRLGGGDLRRRALQA
jgi:uncharacterized membrane protein